MTENSNGMVMPVSPMYGGGGGFGGGFGYGSDFWLIFILLICFGGFGWGNGGFGGGIGNIAADSAAMYPWMNQSNQINGGFRDQMLNTTVNGIQNAITSGFGDVQLGIAGINQNICQTGNGITSAIASGFSQAEIANNSRQITNMQQAFANQTAMNQGFNGVQTSMNQGFNGLTSQVAQNGYNTSSGIADVKYALATEECATRNANAMNTRDVIENQNRNSQAIIDKLCALELDGVKNQLAQAQRDNVALQNQLNMASFRESQAAQNTFISQGFANEVDQLYNRLKNCPVGTTPVYGNTPIFTCPQTMNAGCGCGM